MTKNFLSLIALLLFLREARSQQYNLFETNLTCNKSQKELILQGHEKIKGILGKMRSEGMLVTFAVSQELQKESISVSYSIAAESEAKFKEVASEWKRRAEFSDADFFKTFWKACPTRKDTLMNKIKVMYPLIKDFWAPVGVVDGIDELPDPKLDYKIVVDFTAIPTIGDSKSKMDSSAANWALSDIGRIYNLHIAAGIPKEKIHFVVAVHAFAARSFYKNEEYRKRYKIDNPNLSVIEELDKAGVKFLVCGQSLNWMGDKKEMLLPQAKVSLTAQTTLSSYQLKGYALKSMNND
jgi:intracellular sulfur oxidation DsrE/DsrF family protein